MGHPAGRAFRGPPRRGVRASSPAPGRAQPATPPAFPSRLPHLMQTHPGGPSAPSEHHQPEPAALAGPRELPGPCPGMRARGRGEVQDPGSPGVWRSWSVGSRCPTRPPAPGFWDPPTQPPPSSPQAPGPGPALTARPPPPTPRTPPPSVRVPVWVVCQERCKAGAWLPAGAVGSGRVRGASGERGPREVPWGVRARGAGPGGEGPGQARPLWWPGRGGGISGWAVFGPSSRAPWGEGDPGREGGGAAGAKGEVKEAKGQRPKAKKPTAPGIPRRSPIQVLTRPDPA